MVNRAVRALRRRLAGGGPRDAGITLAELTVTMVIGGILLALVATVVVQAYQLQGKTTARENDTTDAQIVMDTMSRALRVAVSLPDPSDSDKSLPAFSVISPTEVTFTTNLGADPSRVNYKLTNGVLTQTVYKPVKAGLGKASTFVTSGASRPLSTKVVRSGGAALFSYQYLSGNDCTDTVPATDAISKVCAVQIMLTVDTDGSGPLVGTTLDAVVVNQNLNKD